MVLFFFTLNEISEFLVKLFSVVLYTVSATKWLELNQLCSFNGLYILYALYLFQITVFLNL